MADQPTHHHHYAPADLPRTIGELRESGWASVPVSEELRRNAAGRIAAGEPLVPGVLGFEDTVIPQMENALLAGHDFILLGERGQAKTRVIRSLVQLLAYERRAPEADVFWRSLPVAGDGLEGRMEDTPAEGRLRVKTGTLTNASALAGYVSAADGEELVFSIMVNDAWRIQRARRVQDEIGARLAEFTR